MRRVLVLLATLAIVRPAHAQPDDSVATLASRTDALVREISRLRGLRLKRPVPNEVIDRDELRRRLIALAADDQARTQSKAIALARWGMIPLATDYGALLVDLLAEQIAGYYDTETKQLAISTSAGADPDWAEMVLAHELQHALQDQAFDLKKLDDLPPAEDDARVARLALVEGDGVAVMLELMLHRAGIRIPWNNPELAAAVEKALLPPGNDNLAKAPLAIREAMMFPYRAGFQFVAALRRRKPWSAVDAAFARPPRSTEQILHADKYAADERPLEVAIRPLASLPGYAVAHETVWGEHGFALLLRSLGVDERAAAIAAAGWGGDRMLVLARTGEPRARKAVGIARLEWDSEVDAIEAAEAAVKAIDAAVIGAIVEHAATRTRWLDIDGTVSWVERQGSSLVIVRGAPLPAAAALATELWTAATVSAPR